MTALLEIKDIIIPRTAHRTDEQYVNSSIPANRTWPLWNVCTSRKRQPWANQVMLIPSTVTSVEIASTHCSSFQHARIYPAGITVYECDVNGIRRNTWLLQKREAWKPDTLLVTKMWCIIATLPLPPPPPMLTYPSPTVIVPNVFLSISTKLYIIMTSRN